MMNNPKEIECARLAWAAKVKQAKNKLRGVQSEKFGNPLSGMKPWPIEYQGIKQLLLIPIVWIGLLLFVLMVPLIYIGYRVEKYLRARELRKKINKPFDSSEFAEPEYKTIGALWEAFELYEELGMRESADLLDQWLVVLYGQEWADYINVKEKIRNTSKRQTAAHLRYYEGKSTVRIHFKPPVKATIRTLTEVLPPYASKR